MRSLSLSERRIRIYISMVVYALFLLTEVKISFQTDIFQLF